MARVLVRWRWAVLALALALIAVAAVFGVSVAQSLTPGGFEVEDGRAVRARAEIGRVFAVFEPDVLVLVPLDEPRPGPQQAEHVRAVESTLAAVPGVTDVVGPGSADPDEAERLLSRDGRTALLMVSLEGDERAKEAVFPRLAAQARSADPEVLIGGEIAAAVAGQEIAAEDLKRAELVTLPIAAVLLLFFFRGPVAAAVPLVLGAGSIAASTALLRALTELTPISLFALNIVTFLGLGLAIDYSLFIVGRFREEREASDDIVVSISATLRTAGKTVLYSAAAVAVSLLALLWVPIPLLRSIAVGGSFIVATTATMALIVLPCLLAVLGPRIDLGRWRARRTPADAARRWERLAKVVMRRPGLLAAGIATALVVTALPFLRVHPAISDARIFPVGHEVRQVQERLHAPQGFGHNGIARLDVMLVVGSDPATAESARRTVLDVSSELAALPGVTAVEGANTALAGLPPGVDLGRLPPPAVDAVRRWVARDAALLRVSLDREPGTPGANAIVDAIDALPLPTIVAGEAAVAAEVRDVLHERLPWALTTIAVATFAVVLLAFGAIPVAIKAVVTNALSLTASFGALVWVFQDGRFEHALSYTSPGSIDPLVPVLMFAIVFGLSMDYELFLLSRIKQDYDRTGDPSGCVARGLAQTAGVITSAASVLIIVMLGFAFGRILFMRELGVGMAIAIALDASIVRALLVPATMALLGRFNWWAPAWWSRVWRRSGLGVRE